jgi:hypothetical protein
MPRYKAARFRTGAAEPESDTKYEIEAREPMETNVTDMDVDTERNTGADCNTTELDGDSPEPQMDVKVLDDNLTKSDGRFNGGLNSSKSGQHFEVGYTLPWSMQPTMTQTNWTILADRPYRVFMHVASNSRPSFRLGAFHSNVLSSNW